MSTHVFNLPSGVECEVKELTGKHFEILTKEGKGFNNPMQVRMNLMLADVVVRIGNVNFSTLKVDNKNNEKLDFIEKLLAVDRAFLLTEVRQFSMDFDPNFEFVYSYEFEGKQLEHKEDLTIPDGHFPFTPLYKQYTNYDEIEKEIELVLPKSQMKVKFHLLDGIGERIAMYEESPSMQIAFKMRRVRYFDDKAGDKGVWIGLNFNKVPFRDVGFLINKFKEIEGTVDTEVRFEHPKSKELGLGGKDKYVIVNLIAEKAFLFPA